MPRTEKTFLDQVLEDYGEEVLINEHAEGIPVVSTGSLAIDVSLGIGGVPCGRMTEIFGPESSGKTTMCLSIANQTLLKGEKVLYVDTENSLDYGYAEDVLGKDFDKDRMAIVQPLSAEDAFELTEKGINSGFRTIIFDSIAALSPMKELEDEFTDAQVGLAPRLTGKFLRRNAHVIRKNEVAMVLTNQVRANIGAYHGGFETPAGYALKHYTSVRIYITRGKEIVVDDMKIGNFVNFVIKKNKLSVPFRSATTNLIYGKGVDYYRDVIQFASLLGVIKSRGAYLAFEDTTIGLGLAKSSQALAENKELLDNIVNMCYNVAGSVKAMAPVEVEE